MSKYFRTYHLDFSEGATSDDKISKDISSIIGREIVITEKLDGENNCITNTSVFARSHSAPTQNPWSTKIWEIQRNIGRSLNNDVYLFGEGMQAIHSIEYSKLESYFYLFGVRDCDTFLSWKDTEDYSFLLDIPTTPILFKGIVNSEKELRELTNEIYKPNESMLGGQMEGYVIRIADAFKQEDSHKYVLKYVRKNHITTDKHWTKNWKSANINYNSKYGA